MEKKMNFLDTIAAVSTPQGKGGVAMIRISGDQAIAVASRIFRRKKGGSLDELSAGRMTYGEITMPDGGESVDDGMAVVFRAPASFTGEDTVEIYCHGGVLVTRKVLSAALLAGARAAEAGEFTRRAFVSGKMSLSEAEALGCLLEAGNQGQLRLARNGMRGHLTQKTEEIYQSLLSVMTGIYAALDFPDEDLNEYSREQIIDMLESCSDGISRLAATYGTGRAVAEGIPTVICGKANAGKSSVYNRILGYDAAIVTDIEGTTRDVLRQTASLGSTTLLLCDTAGIRSTDDKVESIGIERALEEIDTAELLLAVFDASRPIDADDIMLIERLEATDKCRIALMNKSDLTPNDEAIALIKKHFSNAVEICAKSGTGFDVLGEMVDGLFIDGSIDMDNDAVVTGARQYSSLLLAEQALEGSLNELRAGTPLDLCCIGIEMAMREIGMVDGREIGEEIVAEIFSKFCVGK